MHFIDSPKIAIHNLSLFCLLCSVQFILFLFVKCQIIKIKSKLFIEQITKITKMEEDGGILNAGG